MNDIADVKKTGIPARESLTVEFKSDVEGDAKGCPLEEICEACVALANTEGGDLYLGVEDDGTPSGLKEEHGRPEVMAAHIAANTVPPLRVRAEILNGENLAMRISIPKAQRTLYATREGRAHIRRLKTDGSPATAPLYPQDIVSRMTAMKSIDYSLQSTGRSASAGSRSR